MTPEERQKAFVDSAVAFVAALANKDLPDRQAIWEGVKCALALYTATDDYVAMQTVVDRLRKWNESTIK